MVKRFGRVLERRVDAVLEQVGEFFVGASPLHAAAEQVARLLDGAGIDYAIAGALSLAIHGHVRATEDVDILITREGLERFKAEWLGRGYLDVSPGGRAVRDTVHGVRIDFIVAGEYPGDGKPKPVVFPNPGAAGVEAGKYRVLALPRLVELKLASGMTAPHRLQDLADVLNLVRAASLPRDLAAQLDPFVRPKYDELWLAAQHAEED